MFAFDDAQPINKGGLEYNFEGYNLHPRSLSTKPMSPTRLGGTSWTKGGVPLFREEREKEVYV